MLDYIIRFQNTFTSSFLFLKNFTYMMEKNIDLTKLLSSEIFEIRFDFDQWPSNHTDEGTYIRPYNGSLFNMRHCYKEIFHEKRFDLIDEE